jgi:hypothetical protein
MLEFAESGTGTSVLLSELTTLIRTFSSEPSMEFRISTAPEMPVSKTPNPEICEQKCCFSFSLNKIVGAY